MSGGAAKDSAREVEHIKPYGDGAGAKTGQVREMFDSIAPAYDFMNRAMTFGVDRLWRRRLVKTVAAGTPRRVLDVATGTGDLAIELARRIDSATVEGIDLSSGMTEIGSRKVSRAGLDGRVTLRCGDCLALDYGDASFDAVTVAYGVRNFENIAAGYREMARVLRPGGVLAVLELSTPSNPLVKPFYSFYTRCVIPVAGRLVSRDSSAYTYLPQSIAAVPQGRKMLDLMASAGLTDCRARTMTFGVCTLYTAVKPAKTMETTNKPT